MTKIAKLVTVMLVSRVIVEDTATRDECYEAAREDFIEQAFAHYDNALHDVQEDENSPYNPEEDNLDGE